jgi:hypothetical protein
VRDPPGYTLDLKLDVREGSWMALDVSPDGKEVVFDLMGDLYVMPIAGGEAATSPAASPGTCSPNTRPTASRSPSPPTGAAATICGS